MDDTRSLLIVRNPRARTAPSERELLEASAPLSKAGWQVEIRTTQAPHHAETLARDAAQADVGAVVACGGDGTVREVASGLVGSETALAVMRGGTANVWAREMGVPDGVRPALAWMVRAERHRVDTGVARLDGGAGERFVLMCSAGLDAAVLREVDGTGSKKRLGRAAFAWPAMRALRTAAPVDALIGIDGGTPERRPLLLLVAGNTRSYGGVLRLTPDALIDDGRLDVSSYSTGPDGGRGTLIGRALFRGLLGRSGDATGIETARGVSVSVEAAAPLPVQVDGEYLGTVQRLEIGVEPSSLVALIGPSGQTLLRG